MHSLVSCQMPPRRLLEQGGQTLPGDRGYFKLVSNTIFMVPIQFGCQRQHAEDSVWMDDNGTLFANTNNSRIFTRDFSLLNPVLEYFCISYFFQYCGIVC